MFSVVFAVKHTASMYGSTISGGLRKSMLGSGGSRLGSRWMSRLGKTSFGRSKHRSQKSRRDGSSKFTAVREGDDPVIWRDGNDVTPLTLRPPESQDDIIPNVFFIFLFFI